MIQQSCHIQFCAFNYDDIFKSMPIITSRIAHKCRRKYQTDKVNQLPVIESSMRHRYPGQSLEMKLV